MLVLITYDVNTSNKEGKRRLSKVAKICKNYGQRVQNSVFECNLTESQLVFIRNDILKVIDFSKDSLRFYNLGNNYHSRINHYGTKESYDPEGNIFL